MSTPLYTLDILRLAAESATHPRLSAPDATVERRAPVCGSRIVVDLGLEAGGAIAAFGQAVHACALGQASAALLARSVIGRTVGDVGQVHTALADWLARDGAPPPDWPEIEVMERARSYPARHGAILLPFAAVAGATR